MLGQSGYAPVRNPSSAFTPSRHISFRCGDMGCRRNLSGTSVGTMSMVPVRRCRSLLTEITPKPALSGTSSDIRIPTTSNSSKHRLEAGFTIFTPRRSQARSFPFPGLLRQRSRRHLSPYWLPTSTGTPTTTSAVGVTISTPTSFHRPPPSTPDSI